MTDEDKRSGENAAAPAGGGSIAHAIGARNLMIIIVTMPLVFLIVVMATIAVFGRPGGQKTPGKDTHGRETLQAAAPARPANEQTGGPALDPAPLILAPESEITSMALDGDRLVLRVAAEEGGEIVIYNLSRGAPEQRIPVVHELSVDRDL